MDDKRLCFVDASVLIAAARKSDAQTLARKVRARNILNDPQREFVASEFLKLETLPIARFFRRTGELRFYSKFFDSITCWAPSGTLISAALDLASEYGLGALDALHICAAIHFDAQFVSAERPTKPIYRAYSNIVSIYED